MKYVYKIVDEYCETFISLENVKQIDFASTLMLSAVCRELTMMKCNVKERRPQDQKCYQFLQESGFYNRRYRNGKMIIEPGNSKIMLIKTGTKIKQDHLKSFVSIMQQTGTHIVNDSSINIKAHLGIIKEICGNSAEWGDSNNRTKKDWTIGAKFEYGKVVFVALDLGQGILKSLRKRNEDKIKDLFKNRSEEDVLERAFKEYYGSRSKDQNRNQGLPFIMLCDAEHKIKDLQVITNNVTINFSKNIKIKFANKQSDFIGTLYSWIVDAECLVS